MINSLDIVTLFTSERWNRFFVRPISYCWLLAKMDLICVFGGLGGSMAFGALLLGDQGVAWPLFLVV